MDGQAYYESLVAQGYAPQEAIKYTQQHYPGFGQAPAAPQPAVMPAPQPMVMPAQLVLPAGFGYFREYTSKYDDCKQHN